MTKLFEQWMGALRDRRAKLRIIQALDPDIIASRIPSAKSLGGGLSEFKFDFGPGYRVYFAVDGQVIVLLLLGGDKGSQRRDIVRARKLLAEYDEERRRDDGGFRI